MREPHPLPMIEDPACPACRSSDWRELGSRRYTAPAAGGAGPSYLRRRLEVLFGLWCPGTSELTIHSLLCRGCGMVIYRPRPEQADLDAKYRHLAAGNRSAQAAGALSPGADTARKEAIVRARARELFRAVECLSGRTPRDLDVLDYGGGSGRLLATFLEHGCRCDLVDLGGDPVAGVRKAGSTLADLPPGNAYDLVVAAHVLEHLADPLAVVRDLRSRLRPDGRLFVEVPMEIWGRPPLHAEPVTHVNFFTRTSLRYLLEAAGLTVLRCRYVSAVHPLEHGRHFAAIRALASPAPADRRPARPGPGDAEPLLSAHPLRRLQSALRFPRAVASYVVDRLRTRRAS